MTSGHMVCHVLSTPNLINLELSMGLFLLRGTFLPLVLLSINNIVNLSHLCQNCTSCFLFPNIFVNLNMKTLSNFVRN